MTDRDTYMIGRRRIWRTRTCAMIAQALDDCEMGMYRRGQVEMRRARAARKRRRGWA
jgi:hypothetical protein